MIDLKVERNEKFHERRRRERRRRLLVRLASLGLVVLVAAGLTLGIRSFSGDETEAEMPSPVQATPAAPPAGLEEGPPLDEAVLPPTPTPLPPEVRGVHVTLGLASLPGKIDEFLELTTAGLTALELDVKDEEGNVGFLAPRVRLAERIGAARAFYDASTAVEKIKAAGVYLIGRVVVFEDPVLADKRPKLAIQTPGGEIWKDARGLGWTNPYDERVWRYNVDVAEAAAQAGFDEIMFDYVRFPSDGDIANAVYPGKVKERKERTIARFLRYAKSRLEPYGVRVSAAVFGLSATRDLGVGQNPRRMARFVDSLYAMAYPSHYRPGELGLDQPSAAPYETVQGTLADFEEALEDRDALVIPWLQDFSLGRTYALPEVQAQIRAARDAGARGFLLWNPLGEYTSEALTDG